MKLWVDDMKDPVEMAALFGEWPDGEWMWVKTASSATAVLAGNRVTVLALDNDLGYESLGDGCDIAHWMLRCVLDGTMDPPHVMRCISYNPVAEREIEATFEDIRKVMKGREEQ